MDGIFSRKYKRVLEILPDVADCARGELVLVGGTALALFYLRHRVSVDLDFVPPRGDERRLKERLKGCLSKRGYRTAASAFQNQFVVNFGDTAIKVEVLEPRRLHRIEEHVFGGASVKVASLDDIFQMKVSCYEDRKEARDLFDIYSILKARGTPLRLLKDLVSKGAPRNIGEVIAMATNPSDADEFRKEVANASS